MQCREIIKALDELAPRAYACDWDNPGFLAGRADKEVKTILVALDATDEVIDQALRIHADMIVTHHPLIFRALKQVNDEQFISRRIVRMIQADISYFAMHTNFDIAPGCMADLASEKIGLNAEAPLEITVQNEHGACGIGKIGERPRAMTLEQIAQQVKTAFDLPFVTVYGSQKITGDIQRVAISPGAGGSMVQIAIAQGAEVLITGDIGHHDGIDAVACGMAIIDAGHYGLEHIFIPFVEAYLKKTFSDQISVIQADPAFPAVIM